MKRKDWERRSGAPASLSRTITSPKNGKLQRKGIIVSGLRRRR